MVSGTDKKATGFDPRRCGGLSVPSRKRLFFLHILPRVMLISAKSTLVSNVETTFRGQNRAPSTVISKVFLYFYL